MRDGGTVGLGGQYLKQNGWRGNNMLAEKPRPDNLIPIIGFPGEFLVMFGAEKTQVDTQYNSLSPEA